MARVIFTADDFGAIPSIDRGILDAVKVGKINSVAAFSNAPRSVNSVKNLLRSAENVGKPVDLGCHLTITSGRPMTKEVKWMTKRGHFRKFGDLKRPKDLSPEKQINALKNEMRAQIDAFLVHKIPVNHLSSHHGALTWFGDYTEALYDIGKEYGITVRSPHFIPKKSNNTYMFLVDQLTRLNLPRQYELALRNYRKNYTKEVDKILKKYKGHITSATDSTHYGPLPLFAFSEKRIHSEYPKKIEEFGKRLTELANEEGIIEFMFHVVQDDYKQLKQFKKQSKRGKHLYKGIDRSYFDSRIIEMKSIMELELPKGIELVSWK